MEKQRDKKISPLLLFLIISLLFHLGLVTFFYLIPKKTAFDEIKKEESQVVWVEPQLPPQIADIERPAVEKRPEKPKFAGQYDSAPKEEMVAKAKPRVKEVKENPLSKENAEKKPAKSSKMEKKQPKQTEKAEKEEVKKEKKEKVAKTENPTESTLPKTPADLNLRPQDVFKKDFKKNNDAPQPKAFASRSSSPSLSYGNPSTPDLFNHDFFPDYKVGGKTYLNVMKLQDVGYFVKMKRILKMRWNPVPAVQSYLASNRLSAGSIECVIGVALDENGKVTELFVIHSSGLGGYDQEALQTIRDSSPFSAPPTQFLKQGQLRMSWTFTVYL